MDPYAVTTQGGTQQHDFERQPLLQPKSTTREISIMSEMRRLMLRALVPIASYFAQQSVQLGNILIVGSLGPVELSISAMSFMIATSTAWLLALGGTTAIDSIGSTSFTNGDELHVIGILLQKYFLTVTVMFVPVAVLWWFIGPLLTALHCSPELAYGTQEFLRILSPSAIGYITFEALKKYLQCQNISLPAFIIAATVSVCNLVLCYVSVHVLEWGFHGAAVVTGSMYCLSAILLLLYIVLVDGSQAWHGWSRDAFKGLPLFASYVWYGVIGIGAEWWAFEVISIAAATLGNLEAATQSVIMTTDSVLALVPFGVGIMTTNRIANLVGAGDMERAKAAAKAASLLALINGSIAMLVLLTLSGRIARMYSDDEEVIAKAVRVFPWAAAFQVSDGLQSVNAGVLRAIGKANLAAHINLTAYYVIAIPLALVLTLRFNYGLSGLWIGLATALTLAGLTEFACVNMKKWNPST